ncbi:hypothetical protein VTN96DRAFT_8829 [Rasamsonia emersonii]
MKDLDAPSIWELGSSLQDRAFRRWDARLGSPPQDEETCVQRGGVSATRCKGWSIQFRTTRPAGIRDTLFPALPLTAKDASCQSRTN